MKIPAKLKRAVGSFDIVIKQVPHLVAERGNRGEWHPKLQEIWQDSELEPQHKTNTFWHEILEIINGEYELKLSHQQIQTLEMGIAQVIAALEEAYGREIGA